MKRTTISFKSLIQTVPKETFIDYYFNNSQKETQKHFNVGYTVFYKFIHYYNIKKPKELINEERKSTCLNKYGVDNVFKDVKKIRNSTINKYGSLEEAYRLRAETAKKNARAKGFNSMSQTPEVQERRKLTCLQKYGVQYSFQSEKVINKIRNTKQVRYGDPGYNNIQKTRQTNLKKYGVESNFGSEDELINGRGTYHKKLRSDLNFREQVINKRVSTCKNKYGEDYYINQIKLMIDSISSKANSKVNSAFMHHLVTLGLPFEKEFKLGNYIYDFKLGKYLVELDPYATHNSSWGIFGNPKAYDYHRKKSLNALENGYKCIHIFDWMNINQILYHLTNHDFDLVDTGKPVKHIFDVKKFELTNEENENTVIIYDDGFNMII